MTKYNHPPQVHQQKPIKPTTAGVIIIIGIAAAMLAGTTLTAQQKLPPHLAATYKYPEPMSLEVPPTPLEGSDMPAAYAKLKAMGATNLPSDDSECPYCPIDGMFYWEPGVGDLRLRLGSYSKEDLCYLIVRTSGLMKNDRGQEESISRNISQLANCTQILLGQPAEFAKQLDGIVAELVHTPGTITLPNGALKNEKTVALGPYRLKLACYVTWGYMVELNMEIRTPFSRTWKDATGQYEQMAGYITHDTRNVVLVKEDHNVIEVPVQKLSAEDRRWLKTAGEMN